MINNQLLEYADRLSCLFSQEASLSSFALESLANAGIALHNLIVVQSSDVIYGNRMEHLTRLKHLYTVCQKRYKKEKTFSSKCRLVHTMQLLANEPFAYCIPWIEKCSLLCGKFIEQEITMHRDCILPHWLWSIAYWHYPLSEDSTEDEDFLCFKRHLADWIYDLQGKDQWAELSTTEALWRIDLLNANAYMFHDNSYNESICSLYYHYRKQIRIGITDDTEKLLAMGLLYRQSLNNKAYPIDYPMKEAVVQVMKDSLCLLPESSDEWLYVFSFLISDLCETILSES